MLALWRHDLIGMVVIWVIMLAAVLWVILQDDDGPPPTWTRQSLTTRSKRIS
jgi:hypothetical protein